MSRILFAWEMGGNLGHIARDLPLAIACREAGHEVLFAVKDLSVCVDAACEFGIAFVQAPVMRSKLLKPGTSGAINYADLLWQTGFCDAQALDAVLLGWQGLFDTFKPDAMVYDFAPRALLAARLASIPVMLLGNGFETPPRVSPLPSFRPWQEVPEKARLDVEERVVARMNAVLASRGKAPIDKLWQLYAGSPLLIAYWPEFDHFGPRAEAEYVGMASRPPARVQGVEWLSDRKHVLVYLQADIEGVENVLTALRELDAEVICVLPNMPAEWVQRYEGLCFFDKPINLHELLVQANLVVTHGSGTVADAVSVGVPVLVVPSATEQYLAGARAEQQGLGFLLRRNRSTENCRAALSELLSNELFQKSTRELAARRAHMDVRSSIGRQVSALATLLSGQSPAVTQIVQTGSNVAMKLI